VEEYPTKTHQSHLRAIIKIPVLSMGMNNWIHTKIRHIIFAVVERYEEKEENTSIGVLLLKL
jgi:hypothetical protein